MGVTTDKDIYIKASRSFDLVLKSIRIFEEYLKDCCRADASEYYRAKNFLKDAEAESQELLKEAKKLLGPIPAYAVKEMGSWKTKQAEDAKFIMHGGTPEVLEAELAADAFLSQWITREEIADYVKKFFELQKSGKRKLANIKARMILDKLFSHIEKARQLQKAAQNKHQRQAP